MQCAREFTVVSHSTLLPVPQKIWVSHSLYCMSHVTVLYLTLLSHIGDARLLLPLRCNAASLGPTQLCFLYRKKYGCHIPCTACHMSRCCT
jgi:hypothetical protein